MRTLLLMLIALVSSVSLAQNSARLLADGRDGLKTRLNLIQNSQNPFLSVFEMSEDLVGLSQLAALVENARHGGRPRLLLDGLGHRVSGQTLKYLMSENVDVRIFRPIHAIPVVRYGLNQATQRMHDKILTSEKGQLVTGGRNSGDKFYDLDRKKENFIEYEVYVEGPLALEARSYQEELWNSTLTRKPYRFIVSPLDRLTVQNKFKKALAELKKQNVLDTNGVSEKTALSPVTGEFHHQQILPNAGRTEGAHLGFMNVVANAKKQIIIDANYLVLTSDEKAALGAAVRRGVDVQIVTNGRRAKASIGDYIIRDAFELAKPELRSLGVSVREFQGPGRIHSKAISADGSDCLIWSFNLDPRSRHTNYEAGVRLQSPVVCRELEAEIHTHMDSSLLTIDHGRQVVPDRKINGAEKALIDVFKEQI